MAVRLFVVGLVLVGIGFPIPVAAWPDLPPPSTLEAAPCTTYESIHPVTTEWTMWLGAGAAGARTDGDASGAAIDAAFVARAGAGLSFGPDVPSYSTGFSLRVGPWLGAEAQRRAALGEGGLELALAPEHGGLAASLRAGAGYGSGAAEAQIGRAVFGSLTLTIGLRGPPMAFRRMGSCPTDEAMKVDWNRHARGVRVFAGARAFAGEDRGPTFVAGLEMDPSLLFPGYSKQRWMGSQPTDTVWTWWLGAGGGARELGSGAGPVRPVALLRVGFGAALTSATVGSYHEIHLGPWAQAEGDLGGALGEGGLEVAMTKERYDGRLYALRAGAGYGVGPSDRGAAISGSLLFGLRHVWGKCAPSYRARGVRVFATVRTWPVEDRGIAIVAGVELDPSLLLPSDEDLWDPLTRPSNTGCERRL